MHESVLGNIFDGRAVHSLCKLLCLYHRITLHLIAPPELSIPEDITQVLVSAGHQVRTFADLADGIRDVDIIYVTRTQEERFPNQQDADRYRGLFRLNQTIYTQNCAPNTVIMHPLPRDSREQAQELDDDLNQNPNLAIFRQTDNGVLVRMALFALVLDVVDEVDNHAQPVTWYTSKRLPT